LHWFPFSFRVVLSSFALLICNHFVSALTLSRCRLFPSFMGVLASGHPPLPRVHSQTVRAIQRPVSETCIYKRPKFRFRHSVGLFPNSRRNSHLIIFFTFHLVRIFLQSLFHSAVECVRCVIFELFQCGQRSILISVCVTTKVIMSNLIF